MKLDDQEALRAALVELEQLNAVAEKSRANAETLLRGLERLSSASSGDDALTVVLSVLSSSVDEAVLCVLVQDEDGSITSLASTDTSLVNKTGHAEKALQRAFDGKPVVLANAIAAQWCSGFDLAFESFGSALFQPIEPLEKKAVLVCLKEDTQAFSKDHLQRLKFFVPLAVQGIRQSESMSEIEAARQTAEQHAKTDFLTGLYNRLALEEHAQTLTASNEEASKLWVALVDLNAFKPINDNFGHDAGDAVLVEIGRRLKTEVGSEAIAARLGGMSLVCFCQASKAVQTSRNGEGELCDASRPRSFIRAMNSMSGRASVSRHFGAQMKVWTVP
ncbi:MAG: GGDEF domain-containing protein [Pseudomonadota bacterium]